MIIWSFRSFSVVSAVFGLVVSVVVFAGSAFFGSSFFGSSFFGAASLVLGALAIAVVFGAAAEACACSDFCFSFILALWKSVDS